MFDDYKYNVEGTINIQVGLRNKQFKEEVYDSPDASADLRDRVSYNKYKCFDQKCRKTFNEMSDLLNHGKIHLEDKRVHTC